MRRGTHVTVDLDRYMLEERDQVLGDLLELAHLDLREIDAPLFRRLNVALVGCSGVFDDNLCLPFEDYRHVELWRHTHTHTIAQGSRHVREAGGRCNYRAWVVGALRA